jgi:rhamnose transport system ATP-binding protein
MSLSIAPGEVHGLVGANGAGKSTFIKMLTGTVEPNRGYIEIDGQPLSLGRPEAALRAGIACIYQDEQLLPELTVLDNLMLDRYETGILAPLPRRRARRRMAAEIAALGFRLALRATVGELSAVQRKEVEIVKALTRRARVLLLDEPTAALPYDEVDHLLGIVRTVRASGVAVLLVSHVLEEVIGVSDRVTVLRNGTTVATVASSDLDNQRLVELMFGQELAGPADARVHEPGEPLLEVEGLSRPPAFDDVSLTVHAGEIVVLTGLAGSGRSEILRAIVGADRPRTGSARIRGRPRRVRSPASAVRNGLSYVPEDRATDGLLRRRSVAENISCASLDRISRLGLLDRGRERALCGRAAADFEIVAPSVKSPIDALSGGNQQKVLLARWFATDADVLILDEPTAGIDVRTKAEIYRLVRDFADAGGAALVVSSDIEEVLAWADVILVVRSGRIVQRFNRSQASRDDVLAAIGGRA